MDYEAFKNSASPGRLEPTTFRQYRSIGGDPPTLEEVAGFGFVPGDLPSGLRNEALAASIQSELLEAERNLSLLEGLAQNLENPAILMGPFTKREAKLSSAIENTFASARELALFDSDPTIFAARERSEVHEVRNYISALQHGFSANEPICLRLICDMHMILLDGIDRNAGKTGEFRTTQNAIGKPHARFEDATFVPPPPRFLKPCLDALERYIHTRDDLPRLVRFALVHYQFECIHPFEDGNGRLGRLLIALQLCNQAQLSVPLVYVSGFFEKHRSDYYGLLLAVSREGQWVDWIRFFLRAVSTQAEDALRRAHTLKDLRTDYQARVRKKRASAMLPTLVDALFTTPAVSIAQVAEIAHMKPKSASNLVLQLVEQGILTEATGREKRRVYVAQEIVDVIEHDFDSL